MATENCSKPTTVSNSAPLASAIVGSAAEKSQHSSSSPAKAKSKPKLAISMSPSSQPAKSISQTKPERKDQVQLAVSKPEKRAHVTERTTERKRGTKRVRSSDGEMT